MVDFLSGISNVNWRKKNIVQISKMGEKSTLFQMSKSASPNTFVISSSADAVLIDLIISMITWQRSMIMIILMPIMLVMKIKMRRSMM